MVTILDLRISFNSQIVQHPHLFILYKVELNLPFSIVKSPVVLLGNKSHVRYVQLLFVARNPDYESEFRVVHVECVP